MMYGTKSHEKTRINDCAMKIFEKSRGYVENAQVYYMLTKRSFFYNSTKIYIKRLQKRLIMLITRLITYFVDKKMAKNMLITFRSKKVESTKMMVLLCKIYKMVFRKKIPGKNSKKQ